MGSPVSPSSELTVATGPLLSPPPAQPTLKPLPRLDSPTSTPPMDATGPPPSLRPAQQTLKPLPSPVSPSSELTVATGPLLSPPPAQRTLKPLPRPVSPTSTPPMDATGPPPS